MLTEYKSWSDSWKHLLKKFFEFLRSLKKQQGNRIKIITI